MAAKVIEHTIDRRQGGGGQQRVQLAVPTAAVAQILAIASRLGMPLTAMVAIEMVRISLDEMYRDVAVERGLDLEGAIADIERGWLEAEEIARKAYRTTKD